MFIIIITFRMNKNKLVFWAVSHCATFDHREDYVDKLQEYLKVDIFSSVSLINSNIMVESFYLVSYVNINYSIKYSTVDCKYLLFLQDFFFRVKPKHYKKANIAD